ncbi:MAG: ABC transporter ATP-binding protein, partial [Candidatus Saccharibacteria bacterium]|nr:ABC transporter ATP-binding protein [Candidatus Saccharibacteria bacterium]
MSVIETKGLTKVYGSTAVLDHLDLEVKKGEVIGYLGPNGAGKTVTIRLLLGLIKSSQGSAKIFGLDAWKDKVEIHKRIAYVPGEANLWPNLTGAETLNLFSNIHGGVDEAYQKKLLKKFKFEPNKKVRNYSKGNKQKINLIAALSSRADLLILDEPTSGLDPLMEQAFREAIFEAKKRGQTIFLSSHILEEVETLCDRIAVLSEGKLVELGTLEELRHLSSVSVDATFTHKPPDVSRIKGVSNVKISGKTLHCQIRGDISPLLKVISDAKPLTFLSREPSLE